MDNLRIVQKKLLKKVLIFKKYQKKLALMFIIISYAIK